jgi:pantetheine-phosphate adenylyltransferase
MKKAVYAGSFDPITSGHTDVIRRLVNVFDEVTVLVADAAHKKYLFTREERVALVKESLFDLSRIKVVSFSGLTTQFAMNEGIQIMVRSLRGTNDWDAEATMAQANKKLCPQVETLFVMTQPEFSHISSSLVKEIALHGGSLKDFVSPHVESALKTHFKG